MKIINKTKYTKILKKSIKINYMKNACLKRSDENKYRAYG